MSDQPGKKRPLRRLLKVAAVLVILLLIVIALLPSMVSWGLLRGTITGVIEDNINGKATIDRLSIGWFSAQTVEGVSIVSDDGQTTLDATATLDRGLLSLLFSGGDYGTLTLSGAASAVRRADGSTSLDTLLKHAPPRDPREREPAERDSRDHAPAEPPAFTAKVVIDDFDVMLTDESTNDVIELRDLKGALTLDPRHASDIVLEAVTIAAGEAGALRVLGGVQSLLDERGALNLDGMKAQVEVGIEAMPLTLIDALAGMNNRLVALLGDSVRRAEIRFDGSRRDGQAFISLATPALDVTGEAALTGGRLLVSPEKPILARLRPDPAVMNAWLDDKTLASLGLATRPRLSSESAAEPGVIEIELSHAAIALPEDGSLNLAGAPIALAVRAGGLRLDDVGVAGMDSVALESLNVSITSDDVTQRIAVALDHRLAVNGRPSSTMTADLGAKEVVGADGAVMFDPARLEGEVHVRALATAIARPFLGDAPIDLARDIGETLDVDATFSSGATRGITVIAAASNLDASLSADVDEHGGIVVKTIDVLTTLHPDLVASLLPDQAWRLPPDLTVMGRDVTLPARAEGEPLDLRAISFGNFTFALAGDLIERTIDGQPTLSIEGFNVNAASSRLDEGIDVVSTFGALGAMGSINQRVTNLFDANGALTPRDALAAGSITLEDIGVEQVRLVAPEFADVFQAAAKSPLRLHVVNTLAAEGTITADIHATNGTIDLTSQVTRGGGVITLQSLAATIDDLTDDVMRLLQKDNAAPIMLAAERVSLAMQSPIVLARETDAGFEVAETIQTEARFAVRDGVLTNGPVVPQRYRLADTQGTATVSLDRGMGALSYRATGTTVLQDVNTREPFSNLAFAYGVEPAGRDSTLATGTLDFTNLNVPRLEIVWGKPVGQISDWVGEQGNLRLDASLPSGGGQRATMVAAFPYLTGTFNVDRGAERIVVTADNPTLTLRAGALEQVLNPVAVEGGDAESASAETGGSPPGGATTRIAVRADVPMSISIRSLVLPAALIDGGALAAEHTNVDLQLTAAAPLALTRVVRGDAGASQTVSFPRLAIGATTNDLARGAQVTIGGTVRAAGAAEGQPDRSTLDIRAGLRNLLSESRELAIENAAIDLDVSIAEFPAWVIDAFSARNSFVQDALGATVTATITARGFSPDAGRLDATVTSANGSTANAMIGGRNGLIRTRKDSPTTASLTLSQELRDRLLYKIHPVFADIRSAKEPLRLTIRDARFSPDNNLSKLDADITVELGEIEIDSGSQLLKVLSFAGAGGETLRTIPGHVGTLDVKIRKGRVMYENFVIQLGGAHGAYKHRIAFAGDIDLVRQRVNSVIGGYPVADAKNSIRELAVLPDSATFGLKFSGDLYDATGNPKPLSWTPVIDFDAEDVIKGFLGGEFLNPFGDGDEAPPQPLQPEQPRERPRRRDRDNAG